MIRFRLAALRATFLVVAGAFLLLSLTLRTTLAAGRTPSQTLPSISQRIVGGEFDYTVRSRDSLTSICSRFGVSATAIASLNEIKHRHSALHPGRILRIDTRHIVPMILGHGILINIPQRMLFFFEGSRVTKYYPVSVGRPTWPTPVGKFIVVQNRENPTWMVPRSIQLEMERKGKEVLTCVPPGPDNPLGHYALNLSITGYQNPRHNFAA